MAKRRSRAKRPAETSTPRAAQSPRRAGGGRRRSLPWLVGGSLATVLVVLVVVAMQRADGGGSAGAANTPAQASAGSVASGGIPGFSLIDINGSSVTVPAGRPGVLVFTASYCTPCITQAPGLVSLKRKLGRKFDMLTFSIDPGDSNEAMRRAFGPVVGNTPGYHLGWDRGGTLATTFRITALGTEIVYDARGREVFRGVLSPVDEIAEALRKAGVS